MLNSPPNTGQKWLKRYNCTMIISVVLDDND